MTFNVVIWKGVLMPEVKEPIRVWQQHVNAKSFAPNDKLVRAAMNNHGFQTVDMAEFQAMLLVSYVFQFIFLPVY